MKSKIKVEAITVFGIFITISAIILNIIRPTIIEERIESLFLDYRFHIRNVLKPPEVSHDIVIVEIDERTVEQCGNSWPIARNYQADIIERILSDNPKILAIDIFYPEQQNKEVDDFLSAIFQRSGDMIILATMFMKEGKGTQELPDYMWDDVISKVKHQAELNDANVQAIINMRRVKVTVPELYAYAKLGHVKFNADADGTLRRDQMFINYKLYTENSGDNKQNTDDPGEFFPSLPLVTAAVGLGRTIDNITIHGGRGVSIDDIFIPTDPAGRFRINYLGKEGSFLYISAADILSGEYDHSLLRGKTVFLGASAAQAFDPVVTPFSAKMPGVEKNATVVENIINKRFIRDVPLTVSLLVIVIIGLFLSIIIPKMRAIPGLSLSLGFIVVFSMINQALFTYFELYLNFLYPFVNMAFISIFAGSYKYVTEEIRARDLRKMFSSYVSPKIVEEIINNPERAKLGGERKEVTILFSDIRGFTTFSEKREPEEVVSMLNEYFQEMTDIIFRWDGTLDKFVGDEIMAFWGAPLDQPDHAELAVRCALNMSDRLDQLQEKWRKEDKPVLDCGIGINTGSVLIGNIGAVDKKMDYTAIGDHVNLGARVEALTRNYDTRILITEYTHDEITGMTRFDGFGHVEILEGASVKVKGKETAVKIYTVKCLPHSSRP